MFKHYFSFWYFLYFGDFVNATGLWTKSVLVFSQLRFKKWSKGIPTSRKRVKNKRKLLTLHPQKKEGENISCGKSESECSRKKNKLEKSIFFSAVLLFMGATHGNILNFIFPPSYFPHRPLKKSPGVISFRLMSLWIFSFPLVSLAVCTYRVVQ